MSFAALSSRSNLGVVNSLLDEYMTDQGPITTNQASISASARELVGSHVFQIAVHRTRMAMAITDPNLPDSPLVYVNPAFIKMTGYTVEEAVGRNCRFLQGAETDPETVSRIRQTLALGKALNEEIYNYHKDGSGFWNALHISPIFDDDGKLIYFFASQIDISAQREAASRQVQRLESMGALASGVAHEFNNLMTVVLGSVERAASRTIDERQAHHLGRAQWAARRAGQLAAELLTLARRQATEERVVDLNEVIRQFAGTLGEIAGNNVRLRLNLAPEPIKARVNREQLELVLLNLVHNASDAMAEGGEIVVATTALSASEISSTLNSKTAVEVSVSDTGSGMSPDVKMRATELFFTTKEVGKGTGLGLFLALEFIDHSGGKLIIESEAGQGTNVRMAFPQATER